MSFGSSKAAIVFSNKVRIGFGSLLDRFVIPQRYMFSVSHHPSMPKTAFMKGDTFVTRLIIFILSSVSLIFSRRGQSEIYKSVISSYHIYMINLMRRVVPRHVQPCQSMRKIRNVVYSYSEIPVRLRFTSGGFTGKAIVNFFFKFRSMIPSENPSDRIIGNCSFKFSLRYLFGHLSMLQFCTQK